MVFSSYAMGLFGLLVVEFSLWNNFGNYIWYVSIGFTVLDMFIGDIVSYQLKEVCMLLRGYHAQFNPISWLVLSRRKTFIVPFVSSRMEYQCGSTHIVLN